MLFWERLWENLPYFLDVLIPAAGMTVRIAAGAFVLAIVVGLVLALLQTVKISIITWWCGPTSRSSAAPRCWRSSSSSTSD